MGIGFFATAARADGDPKAAIDGDLRSYYGGERTSAYIVATLGVIAMGTGAVLVTRSSDFSKGLGWPLLGLGAIEAIGATAYAFQVGAEITHYEGELARDPGAYRADELSHIQGTSSRFVAYRLSELGLALAGVGMAAYGFASGRDAWKGAGIGVAATALPFLVIDTVNQGRAARYQDDVARFHPSVAMQPGGGDKPWMLTVGGRF
jgi:hypothetical protein